jgi:hypothetical protein
MGAHAHRIYFHFPFVADVCFDQVGGEDIALEQEVMIGFQSIQDFGQGPWNLLDEFGFLGRQLVQVFVSRFTRVDAVLNTIQAPSAGQQRPGKDCWMDQERGIQCAWPWGSWSKPGCGR